MKIAKKLSILFLLCVVMSAISLPAVASSGKININTAAKEVLVTMKHIGDKLADRIIEYRSKHPFQSPEEIKMVKGVGDKVYEANKDIIIVKEE